MKRLIWLPLAGFLLIAGAAVAAAGSQLVSVTPAAVPAATDDTGNPDAGAIELRAGDLLEEVLADLVGQNVISQDQSDAIVAALESAFDERGADAEARLEEMRQTWEQVQGFMEDGVITQSEVDTLPVENPLRKAFDSIAEDGQVTLDQLRELGPGFGGPGLGGPGHGRGGMHFQFDGPNDRGIDRAPDPGADSDSDDESDS
jgi:hypothetical protein